MRWIALRWQPESDRALRPGGEASAAPTREALGWWALQFTPHVVWQEDEILLLEVSACARLWGGMRKLGEQISQRNPAQAQLLIAQAATSLVAMARLRMRERGQTTPLRLPGDLPLETLGAAAPHLDILARMGCHSWGDVAALPRAGLARRFGPELREALDIAWGLRPELHRWLTLPDVFDQKIELAALAQNATELMWAANRLFAALQLWLRGRHHGVLAVRLEWTLDLRRVDGIDLPPHEQIELRTAEPTQDMAHLRRLAAERLARTRMAAPASWLRLSTLQTAAWAGASTSFLPEDSRKGDPLHQLIERLSERLGVAQVLVPVTEPGHAGHAPETMQRWQPARASVEFPPRRNRPKLSPIPAIQPDALYPAWLLDPAEPLEVRESLPCWQGDALQLLAGPQRLDSQWWVQRDTGAAQPLMRDYFIARRPTGELVWIYRERAAVPGQPCWFLQGLYA